MSIAQPALLAFNRGLISALGLARTDLKRMALSASIQTNLMPRMLGSAMIRPGSAYIGNVQNNAPAKLIPFIFSTTDVRLLEMTDSAMRIWIPGPDGTPELILTRGAVSSTVTNGTFAGSLSGWTNADQSGAASNWFPGNLMQLLGTGFNAAQEYQQIVVASGDIGHEHAVRIVVLRGSVTLNVGVAAGDGTYAMNLAMGIGTHSIAFVPAGNFFIQLSNALAVEGLVVSVAIELSGPVILPTPWSEAKLDLLRSDQSAEIVYVACDGMQQRKILHWGASGQAGQHSWSIELYAPLDGPFLLENIGPITLTPSDITGPITLTASQPLFQPGHVGALFKLSSKGQGVDATLAGANQFSSAVEASGLASGTGRSVSILITGTFVGTVVLQRSVAAVGAWEDVPGQSWTAPVTVGYADGLDNQIIFYRLGIEALYTSGAANCFLGIAGGGLTGICRITDVGSSILAGADVVIQPGNTGILAGLGSISPTSDWWEGAWSDVQGWPTSVALHEGRLWWAGRNRLIGTLADGYESFDDTQVGDAGPINRTIGSGPVDVINWLLPLADLVLGAQSAEKSIRSSVLGGIITPSDFVMKDASTQGSAAVPACKIDYNGVFLQRSGRRIYMLTYTPSYFLMDYAASDLTNFVPDIAIMENGAPLAKGGFVRLAVQRQPDTRVHAILADGTVRVLIIDPTEDEHCWIKVETDGLVEDVVVLPGQGGPTSAEDLVYYLVNRTVNGSVVRTIERWAREDECLGGALSKLADCHVSGTQTRSATISGLGHLVGQPVICWADGRDQGGPFIVSAGGTITLPGPVSTYCAGLGYDWQFQSVKLAYAAELGTPLAQKKRIARLGIVAANTASNGIQYGRDFQTMYDLPATYKGGPVAEGQVFTTYDDETFAFPGAWDTDSRLCLAGQAPRPAILLAAVIDMETREQA